MNAVPYQGEGGNERSELTEGVFVIGGSLRAIANRPYKDYLRCDVVDCHAEARNDIARKAFSRVAPYDIKLIFNQLAVLQNLTQ